MPKNLALTHGDSMPRVSFRLRQYESRQLELLQTPGIVKKIGQGATYLAMLCFHVYESITHAQRDESEEELTLLQKTTQFYEPYMSHYPVTQDLAEDSEVVVYSRNPSAQDLPEAA